MTADRIEIRGLRVRAQHGVLPHEQEIGQVFVVDLDLDVDLTAAASSDALADTVDYGALSRSVAEAVATTRFDLIERLAGHVADLALSDDRVVAVRVRVAKPHAPLAVDAAEVAVVLRRERAR